MPIYDYECADCGAFEVMRRIAERDAPVDCPQCGGAVDRIHTGAPMLATGDSDSAEAQGSYGMRHRAGCSCC
ncbi:zinc ribbon domain-containing protein [Paraburkholderia acidicola]|uniref:Zinc ribbon domain-containing protein n=1 Tax=Paraburkholderia acidicola TaxID=1912599 RepID=A0ABV1LR25_9BURK